MCGLMIFMPACSRQPPSYPPPAQIVLPSGPEPALPPDPARDRLIAMSNPDADSHIVSGVYTADPGAEWRYTGPNARFRFDVPQTADLIFYLRFYNPADALRARGPMSFSVIINGKRIGSPRYTGSGDLEFRRPIPAGWILKRGPVDVSIEIDPPWHASDGVTYGVMLNAIGFEIEKR
jgi:hypothetical protein